MELTPVKDFLNKIELDFISKKAFNTARDLAEDTEEMELLYSKYYFQFMQETIIRKCSSC